MTKNNKMDDNFMKESMDMRRFVLCLLRKVWIIVLAVVVGAIIGLLSYKLYFAITDGQTRYQIKSEYYITFNEKDYPNGMDYYNAYTWSGFICDDKIVDEVLQKTKDVATKQDVLDSVSSYMLSDYRVLTVIVTNTDQDKLKTISDGYVYGMDRFAKEVNEISSIELWSTGNMEIINIHDKGKNAAVLGAIIAFVVACFVWAVYYCVDDRIYVENDIISNIKNLEFLGYDCEMLKNDTQANIKTLVDSENVKRVEDISDINELKQFDGVILTIPWGKKHSTAIAYDMGLLKKHGIKVYGAVVTDCNEKYLKAYYGRIK